LLELQPLKREGLRGELGEFIRKLDYRLMAEPRGEEATSWRRVIALFAGKPEVFGGEHRKWGAEASPERPPAIAIPIQSQDVEPADVSGEETEGGSRASVGGRRGETEALTLLD